MGGEVRSSSGGFKVLPVRCSQKFASYGSNAVAEEKEFTQYLYIKEHKVVANNDNAAEKGLDRKTIFVANVNITWSADDMTRLFEQFGNIDSVHVGDAKGSRFARVTFKSKKDMKALLQQPFDEYDSEVIPHEHDFCARYIKEKGKKINIRPEDLVGLDKWIKCATKPNAAKLKQESDQFLKEFEEKEELEKKERELKESGMDADGFTMVKYSKSAKRKDSDRTSQAQETTQKKKVKRDREPSFMYRFQLRQAKQQRLQLLRQKFEEDKLKVARMKQARKFKPA